MHSLLHQRWHPTLVKVLDKVFVLFLIGKGLSCELSSTYKWMDDCYFLSFSTVFESYQDDGRMIMKGCVQWNPF